MGQGEHPDFRVLYSDTLTTQPVPVRACYYFDLKGTNEGVVGDFRVDDRHWVNGFTKSRHVRLLGEGRRQTPGSELDAFIAERELNNLGIKLRFQAGSEYPKHERAADMIFDMFGAETLTCEISGREIGRDSAMLLNPWDFERYQALREALLHHNKLGICPTDGSFKDNHIGNWGWWLVHSDYSSCLGAGDEFKPASNKSTQTSDQTSPLTSSASECKTQDIPDNSREIQHEAVDKLERVHNEDLPETLAAMTELVESQSAQGNLPEAGKLKLLIQVHERSQRLFGKNHPQTTTALVNLANSVVLLAQMLILRNDCVGAHKLLKQVAEPLTRAVETMERVHGKDNQYTLIGITSLDQTLTFLSVTSCAIGDRSAGHEVAQRLLKAQERVLGKEHPDTLRTSKLLANWSPEIITKEPPKSGIRGIWRKFLGTFRPGSDGRTK